MTILRQSTQIEVRVGPFIDKTDGFTPETGITLSGADEAELLKADGAATVSISGATWSAVLGADGWYDLTLTSSHTDTVGELVVVVQDISECLPVFARFQVVEEAVYDALFAASAVNTVGGFTTAAKAEIETEANDALVAQKLDHLVAVAESSDVVNNSVVAKLAAVGGAWADFNPNTDSLEALESISSDILVDTGTTGVQVADKSGYSLAADQSAVTVGTVNALGTQAKLDVNVEADTAIADAKLDHLVAVAESGDVVNNSIIAKLASASATPAFTSYDNQTDSLEAIRTRGDAAWTTGGGGSITDILNVTPAIPQSIDLANTATVRIGLMLTNAVDDLPSTAEITPGTISIDYKSIGETTWTAAVTDGACSEQAGLVYFDEVFDSGTGYAEGDSIRITFKNQKITVAANDYEVTDANGVIFYTEIRQTMRGTDSSPTAAAIADAVLQESVDDHAATANSLAEHIDELQVDTADMQPKLGTPSVDISADIAAILGSAQTEAYATDGATATVPQLLYMIWSAVSQFSIASTTLTCKQLDGTTTSMTFTLDSATDPTSRTRAT